MKAEPRIYEKRPPWYGLKEVSRTETTVRFKTKTGCRLVLVSEIEAYERMKGESC